MGHAPLLYDEMSAVENLVYFSALYGSTTAPAARKPSAPSASTPRWSAASASIRRACASASRWPAPSCIAPELLFLDEPFSNVDMRSAKQMTSLLAKMRDQGTTIFVVTHQAAIMEPVADECFVLDAGRLSPAKREFPPACSRPIWPKNARRCNRNRCNRKSLRAEMEAKP